MNFAAELVPIAYASALIDLATELGVPRDDLLQAARVKPQQLESPNGRLSFIDFNLLASAALTLCKEPALGLLLGQRLNVSTHGILGYAVLSSATLDKAIQFALKYYRVLGLAYELERVEEFERVELRASEAMPLGALNRFAAEGLLCSLHSIAQFLLGEKCTESKSASLIRRRHTPPVTPRYLVCACSSTRPTIASAFRSTTCNAPWPWPTRQRCTCASNNAKRCSPRWMFKTPCSPACADCCSPGPAISPTWAAPPKPCTPAAEACAGICQPWARVINKYSTTYANAWPCSTSALRNCRCMKLRTCWGLVMRRIFVGRSRSGPASCRVTIGEG